MQETENVRASRFMPKRDFFKGEEGIRLVYLLVGLIAIVILFAVTQFSAKSICCGDFDGFYHIRVSQMLWEAWKSGHFLPEFVALPLSTLNPQSYADHHFLFHVLQIPFLWFFEPATAAKVGAVVFASLAVFSCYWLIWRERVPYPLLWLVALLAAAQPFIYRMNMAKAPPLSIVLLVVGFWLLFKRKYVWLFPLMFVFVWTYSLFPLLLIAALFWVTIISWNERRIEWQPPVYAFGGMILGNVINPYIPRNLLLLWEHFVTKIGGTSTFSVPVGGEWYPYSTSDLLMLAPVTLAAMFLGYVFFVPPRDKKFDEKSAFFLLFATFLFLATFQSKRFMEYFPPIAIMFVAFAFNAYRSYRAGQNTAPVVELPEEFRRDLAPFLDKPETISEAEAPQKKETWTDALATAAGVLLFIHFITFAVNPFKAIGFPKKLADQDSLVSMYSNPNGIEGKPEKFQRAMTWINENTADRELIFNSEWDDFPKLFYYSPRRGFVTGLDPTYLFTKNAELGQMHFDIATGKADNPADLIREKFGAKYILFNINGNDDFYAKLMESGWIDKVYEDDEAIILKMRDKKGAPPDETEGDGTDATDDELKDADEDDS